ncbi:MAG: ABC transporter permease [Acidobacteria bacterium]|nr:ABC transporter permease [Acidobacteriota bacterium]
MWDALWVDVRHSLRGLRRSPGFTLVVILTVALAVGATTTIYSLLSAIVLRTVAVTDPDRLVSISASDIRTTQTGYLYADTFVAYRTVQHSLSTMSMYSGGGLLRVEARSATADGNVEGVTPEYLDLLGAKVAAGRFFTDADDAVTPVGVISDRFRRRIFGDDATVIGETVKLNGKPVTIVGVTAPGFAGLEFDGGADLFLPIAVLRHVAGGPTRPLRSFNIVGRLAPGVTVTQARAELRAQWPGIQGATVPPSLSAGEQQALRSQRIEIESLASGFSGLRRLYGTSLIVLIALAVVLLAIACVNLAGLLLARSLARRHQIAVRLALGAGHGRIFQQVMVDGVLLALVGLVASLPFAWWATRVLTAQLTVARGTPLLQSLAPDARVLAVATLVTLLIGLGIGALPAWRAVSGWMADGLRPGRAITGTLGRSGRLLLIAQVALSMVLLVGAGLFAGTLSRLRANDASLHARRIVWTRLARTPGDREPINRAYLQALLQQLAGIQGADAAALSVYYPAFLGFPGMLPPDHYSRPESVTSAGAEALTEFVSPGFFNTFGIPRLRGRDFTWADDASAPPVALVSESLARRLFPDNEAIGRRLRASSGSATKEFEIIGVVSDVAIGKIREPHQPVVFRPIVQEPAQAQFPLAHVRVTGDVKTVRDGYVRVVESQGRHFVRVLFTLNEWVDYALLRERLTAGLATFAGVLTVVLACIGVYGLLAYAVTSRLREIGVRLALGATRTEVVRMIVFDGLMIAVPGVAIGVPCALASARLVRAQLYGIGPSDPSTIIGASTIFVLTGVVASLVPAWQASKIDPMEALRQE